MAAAAVLVGASVIAAGVGAGALWVFEVLAATGVLVGLGVAFGALDGGLRLPWRRRRDADPDLVPAELTATVENELARLDPVEHRRLDLGTPWPVVVVGPTGVTLAGVADRVSAANLARVQELLVEVRRVVRSLPSERPVVVRGALVVPDTQVPTQAPGEVAAVAAADLVDLIDRGPIVAMATVTALFALLSGHLAPDLPARVV